MIEFLLGLSVGIWIGTTYNCSPYIEFIVLTAKNTAKGLEKRNNEKIE